MPASVRVIAGPAKSGKTTVLLAQYRAALRAGGIGSGLWIAPMHAAATETKARLLSDDFAGCFSPGCYTFKQFADAVLAFSGEAIHPIGRLAKRQLIARLVADAHAAGKLKHFGPIAEKPGLLDLVAELISDLKRQEVWPEVFAEQIKKCGATDKDRELAWLYTEYQRLLTAHHLYDAEGRFWSAREALKKLSKDQWAQFATLKHVVVDGFADFTVTQHEILQILAQHTDQLTISLPLEEDPGREDLFFKPQKTFSELSQRHPGLQVEWLPRSTAPKWPAMDQVERHLFRNPRSLPPAPDGNGIHVIAASGQLAEIQAVARRIKQLLVDGDADRNHQPVRPHEIAVVFRSAGAMATLTQEVFREYGIPFAMESGDRLNRSPLLMAMTAILRLQLEDWPFRQLLAVLSSNFFRPDWPEWLEGHAAAATDWAIRQLQLPRGRKALIDAIQWRIKPQADEEQTEQLDDFDLDAKRRERGRFATAVQLLGRLEKTLSTLQRDRTIADWIPALQSIAVDLGILKESSPSDADGDDVARRSADDVAWAAFKASLGIEVLLDQWLGREPIKLSLSQLLDRVEDTLSVEPLPARTEEVGRVRIVSAQSIRAIEVPYLFVAGLSEKAFPPPSREDRVYSESEYQRLNNVGLRFIDHRERSCDEMLLFYEVVTRPSRRLTLSFPALDESAQPLLASPFLIELERTLSGQLTRTSEISLSPVPQQEPLLSPTEWRIKAVAELTQEKPKRMALWLGQAGESSTLPGGVSQIAQALETTIARGQKQFGPFEGLFESPAAQEVLARRYGPEHCWSVSRLEDYAYCSYRFLLGNVLKVQPLPELSLETDFGRRGQLAHEALATLHRRLHELSAPLPSVAGPETVAKLTDETLAILFENVRSGSPLEKALRTIDLRLIGRWLQEYAQQHDRYEANDKLDQPLEPAHFEVSFGMSGRRASGDKLSTEKPFELASGDETIRLSGRIDRIDIGVVGGQVVFNVLDYKTGSRTRLKMTDIEAGLALQLPIYALAVQELLMIDRRAVPWRVGYWYLREKGFDGMPAFHSQTDEGIAETDDWRELRGKLLARVVAMVKGIRQGQFPVYSLDDDCTGRCPYSTVCRVGQIRAMEKVWEPSTPTAASP